VKRRRDNRFRLGNGGVCEASLYEFTGRGEEGGDPPVIRIAAVSLEEALAYG
jgi:hypothetical protein